MTHQLRWSALLWSTLVIASCAGEDQRPAMRPELLQFSRVDKAHATSKGANTIVAVIDWQFDAGGAAVARYTSPASMVPGEVIGKLKPWHGAWMVEIVHQVAPEAQIMPIIGRSQKGDGYQDYIIQGIRYAAEHGAVAVSSSMGPVDQTEALRAAIDFAEQRGTVFVNVHPENIAARGESFTPCAPASCDSRILHTGVVSAPDHQTRPSDARQVYTWPYDLAAKFKDGWGYSNAPPVAAGVIALMKSANPRLTPEELRQLLRETTYDHEGFRVLDAEAAVRAAMARRRDAAPPRRATHASSMPLPPGH
jgi:subtilisin family serine protease